MTVAKGIKKPGKPRKDFPLFAANNGQWAKKIQGRKVYFGPWSDPDAAERLWDAQKDDLRAGRDPKARRVVEGSVSVDDMCQEFLTSKQAKLEQNDLSQRQFDDLLRCCKVLVKHFGSNRSIEDIRPQDFLRLKLELARKWKSPHGLKREIQNARSVFNYAMDAELTEKNIKFGPDFKAPKKETIRRHDHEKKRRQGSKDFTAAECKLLVEHAPNAAMKCFVLLGLNLGAGNSDLRTLRFSDVDLQRGWWDSLRNKTAADRKAKLWRRTVKAIQVYLEVRPDPLDDDDGDLVFITRHGLPYGNGRSGNDPIGSEFIKCLKWLDLRSEKGPGRSFYGLRHTFETLASSLRDQQAIDLAMGHVDDSMPAKYRQRFDEERLVELSDYVHRRIFGRRAAK